MGNVMAKNGGGPTSHIPAHESIVTVAPFRAWRSSQIVVAAFIHAAFRDFPFYLQLAVLKNQSSKRNQKCITYAYHLQRDIFV